MMKPEQVRERMELFGFANSETERDSFLKEVCNDYEDLFYQLVEKEDKVNTLSDAVKYYKNMEENIKQMLSAVSEISEKTENAAQKAAQLTVKEAQNQADTILADASQQAADVLEEAKEQAQKIVENADVEIADAKKELEKIKQEFEAYGRRFYDFMEAQKAFFEEHKIDVETPQVKEGFTSGILEIKEVSPAAPVAAHIAEPVQTNIQVPVEQPVPTAAASPVAERETADVTINQIKKIPNPAAAHQPTIEEIQANIPQDIRNIPISDHTETLDEIIQSIKKSYEEVEHKQ